MVHSNPEGWSQKRSGTHSVDREVRDQPYGSSYQETFNSKEEFQSGELSTHQPASEDNE